MGSSIPVDPAADRTSESPPHRRGRKRKRRLEPGVRYGLIFGLLLVAAVLVQFIVHIVRTDPRDARAIAERELQLNTLQPGEHVVRSVSVVKRPAVNYFRATRGLLVLTNRRLIYLGLEPRDLLAAADLPPTFEERDFALDTLVNVSAGRTFFALSKAIVVKTPTEMLRLGVPSNQSVSAERMIATMQARHERAAALSAVQRASERKAEAQRKAIEAQRHQPKYYTVKAGDAVGSIATIWNTTPDRIRAWNHLPDNRIRVGQVLMVRPGF